MYCWLGWEILTLIWQDMKWTFFRFLFPFRLNLSTPNKILVLLPVSQNKPPRSYHRLLSTVLNRSWWYIRMMYKFYLTFKHRLQSLEYFPNLDTCSLLCAMIFEEQTLSRTSCPSTLHINYLCNKARSRSTAVNKLLHLKILFRSGNFMTFHVY